MKIIMWGCFTKRSTHPFVIHRTREDANYEVRNDPRKWLKPFVQRVILDFKKPCHYDIYKHEYKRI